MDWFFLMVAGCLFVFLAVAPACGVGVKRKETPAKSPTKEPVNYGNGVYLFRGDAEEFAERLAKLKSEYPKLEVTGIASDVHSGYYHGNWVVNFEQKK